MFKGGSCSYYKRTTLDTREYSLAARYFSTTFLVTVVDLPSVSFTITVPL